MFARIDVASPEPLVTKLERWQGTKEPRFAHLLSGEPERAARVGESSAPAPRVDRQTALEAEVADLKERVRKLEEQLADLLG